MIERLIQVRPDSDAVFREWKRLIVAHSVKGVQVHDARLVAAMAVYGKPASHSQRCRLFGEVIDARTMSVSGIALKDNEDLPKGRVLSPALAPERFDGFQLGGFPRGNGSRDDADNSGNRQGFQGHTP